MKKEKIDINELIKKASKAGLVKTYEEFLKTPDAIEYAVSEEEEKYYNKFSKNKYDIGDIVYVLKSSYKNGLVGQKHLFVIVAFNTIIDINYFGFLLSSKIYKKNYKYNVLLNKSDTNKLDYDSIISDDLIIINNDDILYKIGKVNKKELNKFISIYNSRFSNKNISC